MNKVLTEKTTTISEFKKNPNQEVDAAGDVPFAVLTNNKPSFYVLSPKTFEAISELLWEAEMLPMVKKRIKETRIKIRIEDLA